MITSLAHLTPHSTTYSLSILHHRDIPRYRRNIQSKRTIMASFSAAASSDLLEAAKHTVDNYVTSDMVIGLGSGHASNLAIQHLGQKLRQGCLTNILGIPTSVASASVATKAGIPVDKYEDNMQIDFAFVDADVVEEGTLAAVIGRRKIEGDESIIEEKCIMRTARNLVFMVNEKQYTKHADGSIPVLVKTGNWLEAAEEIDDLFLGDAEVWRRPTHGHADPLGGNFPLVTKEGHYVLDVIFTSPILDLAEVAKTLDEIDGVVNHGVISGIDCTAIVASTTGIIVINNLSKLHS
ncbi:probable ribose-5-phosphate isomerase 4, chloroplastic isoform X2 [Asparagus officinalis]|uniref:probable ribose-5-phosphate isomerase 4, chloroplastic isoform X2 n=1 Tax=Asparagus officinalis TaxID=4686 RepID=UPI00098E86DE|nr:probable ribose-5-phosphate isomerase 4, chloroplastic isoform X2 [Asparagus officinalis]